MISLNVFRTNIAQKELKYKIYSHFFTIILLFFRVPGSFVIKIEHPPGKQQKGQKKLDNATKKICKYRLLV